MKLVKRTTTIVLRTFRDQSARKNPVSSRSPSPFQDHSAWRPNRDASLREGFEIWGFDCSPASTKPLLPIKWRSPSNGLAAPSSENARGASSRTCHNRSTQLFSTCRLPSSGPQSPILRSPFAAGCERSGRGQVCGKQFPVPNVLNQVAAIIPLGRIAVLFQSAYNFPKLRCISARRSADVS